MFNTSTHLLFVLKKHVEDLEESSAFDGDFEHGWKNACAEMLRLFATLEQVVGKEIREAGKAEVKS